MSASWLKSSVIGLLILISTVVCADGYVIYSSWETEWRARADAVRTSKLMSVEAEVRPAQLSGRNWYRVVVHVDSQSAQRLMLDAFDKDWDVWYLSATDSSWSTSVANISKPLFSEDGDADILGPARLIVDPSLAQETVELDQESVDSTPSQSQPIAMLDSESSESSLHEETDVVSPTPTESDPSSVEESEPVPPVDSDGDLADAVDPNANGEPTLTVESTLREVETIQQQAQDLISNWVQREDQTTYQMPIEIDNESRENQNLVPTRESWFNVLRIPERRRR